MIAKPKLKFETSHFSVQRIMLPLEYCVRLSDYAEVTRYRQPNCSVYMGEEKVITELGKWKLLYFWNALKSFFLNDIFFFFNFCLSNPKLLIFFLHSSLSPFLIFDKWVLVCDSKFCFYRLPYYFKRCNQLNLNC